MLSVKEAANALGVSPRTVYRMIQDGQLEARRIRGVWRISPAKVSTVNLKKAS